MKQEDLGLLIKDLCARAPYDVKVCLTYEGKQYQGVLDAVYPKDNCVIVDKLDHKISYNEWASVDYGRFNVEEEDVRPYLRPMSDMTKEEKMKIASMANFSQLTKSAQIVNCCSPIINYCYSRHLDINGLIPKGLALEAPKGMY